MILNQRQKLSLFNSKNEQIARFVFALIFENNTSLRLQSDLALKEEELVAYASDHLVASSIGSRSINWRRLGLSRELGDYFSACNTLNTQRNEACLLELAEIGVKLNSIGVIPFLLKGVSGLVRNLYPSIGFRTLSDIDILVPESKFFDAVVCLKEAGFSCPEKQEEEYFLQRDFKTVQEYPTLLADGNEFAIDLHKHSAIHLREFHQFDNLLKEESSKVRVGDAFFLQPSKRFHAAHALYHTMVQDLHGLTGFVRMRHVVDYTTMKAFDHANSNSSSRYIDQKYFSDCHLSKQYEQTEAMSLSFQKKNALSFRNIVSFHYPETIIQSGRFLSYVRGAFMAPSKFFSGKFYKALIARYRRSIVHLPRSD